MAGELRTVVAAPLIVPGRPLEAWASIELDATILVTAMKVPILRTTGYDDALARSVYPLPR